MHTHTHTHWHTYTHTNIHACLLQVAELENSFCKLDCPLQVWAPSGECRSVFLWRVAIINLLDHPWVLLSSITLCTLHCDGCKAYAWLISVSCGFWLSTSSPNSLRTITLSCLWHTHAHTSDSTPHSMHVISPPPPYMTLQWLSHWLGIWHIVIWDHALVSLGLFEPLYVVGLTLRDGLREEQVSRTRQFK